MAATGRGFLGFDRLVSGWLADGAPVAETKLAMIGYGHCRKSASSTSAACCSLTISRLVSVAGARVSWRSKLAMAVLRCRCRTLGWEQANERTNDDETRASFGQIFSRHCQAAIPLEPGANDWGQVLGVSYRHDSSTGDPDAKENKNPWIREDVGRPWDMGK